jgi:hypothetical protein
MALWTRRLHEYSLYIICLYNYWNSWIMRYYKLFLKEVPKNFSKNWYVLKNDSLLEYYMYDFEPWSLSIEFFSFYDRETTNMITCFKILGQSIFKSIHNCIYNLFFIFIWINILYAYYEMDDWGLIPNKWRGFSFQHRLRPGPGTHPISCLYSSLCQGLFHKKKKLPQRGTDNIKNV